MRGASTLYFDPPPADRAPRFETHEVSDHQITECREPRFFRAGSAERQPCLRVMTKAGKTFEVWRLTQDELDRLASAGVREGETLTFGIWNAERPVVMSVAAADRVLVSYHTRREVVLGRGKTRMLWGGVGLAAIAAAFMTWLGLRSGGASSGSRESA